MQPEEEETELALLPALLFFLVPTTSSGVVAETVKLWLLQQNITFEYVVSYQPNRRNTVLNHALSFLPGNTTYPIIMLKVNHPNNKIIWYNKITAYLMNLTGLNLVTSFDSVSFESPQ